jgi:protein phosphatase
MAHFVDLEFAAKTDTGLVRPHNEDAIEVSPEHGLAVLADGMGGYNAGEVASGIAVAIIKESIATRLHDFKWKSSGATSRLLHQHLQEAVERANSTILQVARSDPQYSGMGTTIVAALFHHDRVVVAHVGDSRLYRFRRGELALLTRDHSFLQEQIDAGMIGAEEARFSPHRNLITRAVGIDEVVNVEIHEHQILTGDLYLLCSDGLSDMLSTEEIAALFAMPRNGLDELAEQCVLAANHNGGRDNTSAVIAEVRKFKAMESWGESLMAYLRNKAGT